MIYILLLIVAIGLNIWLSVFSWYRRNRPGVTTFFLIMISEIFWMSSIIFMHLSATKHTSKIWLRLELLSISLIPVLLLVFIFQFVGLRVINRAKILILLIIPVLTQIAIWTDELFHFFFSEINLGKIDGLMVIDSWKPGPWFIVHSIYSFGLVFVALIWFFVYAVRNFKVYKGQSISIIAGSLILVLPVLAIAVGLIPAKVNVLPICFVIMNLCFAWAIFRYKLFTVVPVARNKLIDIMSDGMIVLDRQNRIVDLNPAAQSQVKISIDNAVGKRASEIFTLWNEIEIIIANPEVSETEVSILSNEEKIFYELKISGLRNRKNELVGRLILFKDITERKNIEYEKDTLLNTLNEKNKELEMLYSMALDANPMTGLPGNNTITSVISKAVAEKKKSAVIYSDLDNFKAYNDKYGFAKGDDVIKFTASLLKRSLEENRCEKSFIGHIGGDDFILLVPAEKAEIIAISIIKAFDSQIQTFYSPSDIHQGFIISKDRQGNEESFPIISISLALIDLSHNYYSQYVEINDACAAIKKQAKSQKGSVYCIDLRREHQYSN